MSITLVFFLFSFSLWQIPTEIKLVVMLLFRLNLYQVTLYAHERLDAK